MSKSVSDDEKIKQLLGNYKKDWNHHEEKTKEQKAIGEINEGISKYKHRRLPPLNRKEVTEEHVLSLLDAIANFDPLCIQDEETGCTTLHELSLEQRMCIKSVTVKELYDDGQKIGELKKVEFWDKLSALDKMGKFLNMFSDAPQITNNNVVIQERLSHARNRLKNIRSNHEERVYDTELATK